MERDSADSDWSIVTKHASRRRALAAMGTIVAEETLRTGNDELENTTTLSGRVLDSPAHTGTDFEVDAGEAVSVTVDAGVRFDVRDSAGEVLASDDAADSATVEVVSPDDETHATIGGVATIEDGA